MANARKCDVCGAFYEPGNPFDKEPNVRFNGIQLMWHDNADDWYNCDAFGSTAPVKVDLCDECQKKLLIFLHNKEVENDTN